LRNKRKLSGNTNRNIIKKKRPSR